MDAHVTTCFTAEVIQIHPLEEYSFEPLQNAFRTKGYRVRGFLERINGLVRQYMSMRSHFKPIFCCFLGPGSQLAVLCFTKTFTSGLYWRYQTSTNRYCWCQQCLRVRTSLMGVRRRF